MLLNKLTERVNYTKPTWCLSKRSVLIGIPVLQGYLLRRLTSCREPNVVEAAAPYEEKCRTTSNNSSQWRPFEEVSEPKYLPGRNLKKWKVNRSNHTWSICQLNNVAVKVVRDQLAYTNEPILTCMRRIFWSGTSSSRYDIKISDWYNQVSKWLYRMQVSATLILNFLVWCLRKDSKSEVWWDSSALFPMHLHRPNVWRLRRQATETDST